ncbi:MAG: hypothetical protein AAGJ18_05940 [Bacteroidota bacterium]
MRNDICKVVNGVRWTADGKQQPLSISAFIRCQLCPLLILLWQRMQLATDSFCVLTFFSFLFFLSSCQSKITETTPAFYHWQTKLSLSQREHAYLDELSTSTLYIKFFDVDWDFNRQEPTALAILIVADNLPKNLAIIPTVFITNRTLVQIEATAIPDLAQKIAQKLKGQIADVDRSFEEVQFDCDWTVSTKNKYFQLLQLLKKELPTTTNLSATIRLHQIKYLEKTGIPPVNRGMLMYYNMGEVQQLTTNNSILDNAIGQKYIDRLGEYPLPLDVALPLFQWGVLFRNDKMIKLLNQLTEQDLADRQRFNKVSENRWEVVKSTYLDGVYLYAGDWIRLEKSEIEDLKIATNLLQQYLKKEDRRMAFYHLDSAVVAQYPVDFLRSLLLIP